MRTMKTSDESCMLRYMCDANRECTGDMSGSNAIYCQLGTYVFFFLILYFFNIGTIKTFFTEI
jgi:hypothetical protein